MKHYENLIELFQLKTTPETLRQELMKLEKEMHDLEKQVFNYDGELINPDTLVLKMNRVTKNLINLMDSNYLVDVCTYRPHLQLQNVVGIPLISKMFGVYDGIISLVSPEDLEEIHK